MTRRKINVANEAAKAMMGCGCVLMLLPLLAILLLFLGAVVTSI